MQIFLIIFGIIIILLFLQPIFEDVFNIATVIGCVIGAFPLILGILWKTLNTKLALILLTVYATAFVILLILMLIILIRSKSNANGQKVIIVLGCSVKGDRPSLSLLKRVDAAYNYLADFPDSFAVLSGGQGKDENISEAECMYKLLVQKGIDKKRLILEDKSKTTDENIKFSKQLINTDSVAIATSEYHQLRAHMICNRYGLKAYAQSSHTKLNILPTFLLREILAITKELIIK